MVYMPTQTLKLNRKKTGYYFTKWYSDQGKPHDKSFGKNRASAARKFERFRAAWLADETIRNPESAAEVLTIGKAWQLFDAHAQTYYRRADGSQTGEALNFKHAFTHVTDLFDELPAAEFTPMALKQARANMIEYDLAISTINARVRKIRAVFKWLVSEGQIAPSVWHGLQAVTALKRGRTRARATEPIAPVYADYIWQTCEKLPPTLVAMIKVQLLTGARPGEVCIMSAVEIDRSGELWIYEPGQHKTTHHGITRAILIGPQAQEVLAPYLAYAPALPMFSPGRAMQERNAAKVAAHQAKAGQYDYRQMPSYIARAQSYAPTRYADRYRPQAYGKAIADAARRAGVPHWTPNQLRHNAATAIRKAYGLKVAQVVLGHTDEKTTEIYAETDLRQAREAIAKIG